MDENRLLANRKSVISICLNFEQIEITDFFLLNNEGNQIQKFLRKTTLIP